MSQIKKPVSLRGGLNDTTATRSNSFSAANTLAVTCFAALGSLPAVAQEVDDSGVIVLPTIEVETTEVVEPVATPAPYVRPATSTAATETTPRCTLPDFDPELCPELADAQSAAASQAVAGGNPYADANAAFKVDGLSESKFLQPVLNTAQTVSTISKEVMEAKGATSVRELARTTPGVTLGTGEGGNAYGDVLFIRGFRASNDVYIDGVRDAGVTVRENFMTEQVEIAKGPSGTVGGRGTSGGAFNVSTKKAQDEDFTKVTVETGSDTNYRATVDINRAFSDKFQLRFNAMAQDANVAGRGKDDEVYDDRWGYALSARLQATETTAFTLDFYQTDFDQKPDWGVAWDPDAGTPSTEDSSYGVDRDAYYGTDADFQETKQSILTAGTETHFDNGLTWTNKVRLGSGINDYVLTKAGTIDGVAGTVSLSPISKYQESETSAFQSEVKGEARFWGATHKFLFGVEVSSESYDAWGYSGTMERGTCVVDLYDPDPSNTAGCESDPVLDLTVEPNSTDVTTRSIYAFDSMEFGDNWIVSAGLRFDDYHIHRTAPPGRGDAVDVRRNDLLTSANLGVTYKPNESTSYYAAVGYSETPTGEDVDAVADSYGALSADNLYGPEEAISVEIGMKKELMNGNLLATAALFSTVNDNVLEASSDRSYSGQLPTGKYRVSGIELGLSGKVTERLGIYGGLTWMDSEVLETSSTLGAGGKMSNVAHKQANLLMSYDATDRFTFGGQATFSGDLYGGTSISNGNELPDAVHYDLFAEYAVSDNAVVKLSVENVTDALYYDAVYRSDTSPYVYVAPGRSISLSLAMDF